MAKRSPFDGSRKLDNLLLHVAGLVTAVTGVAILLSFFVEVLTSGPHGVELLVLGLITTALVRWPGQPPQYPSGFRLSTCSSL